jgi:hypothetical protein
MNMRSIKRFAGICAGLLFASCSTGGGRQFAPAGNAASPASYLVSLPGAGPLVHRNRAVHPIRPNCCAHAKTLFVSETIGGSSSNGDVQLFTYPNGAYVGQLAAPPEGWSEPQGECVDNRGNVYIANTSRSTIDEYSHGGTFIQSLADTGQYPVSCAFDRTSGNLAVANIISVTGAPGSISIYHGGVLQNSYTVPNMFRVYFLGYAGLAGTLWLDGSNSSGTFQYDSFSGGAFTQVPISGGTIGFPGNVQWSAKTKSMNVGDQSTFANPTVYRVSPTGRITGSTVMVCSTASGCSVAGYFIKGPNLVMAAASASNGAVLIYPYPAGGDPSKIITSPNLAGASFVAVSPNAP